MSARFYRNPDGTGLSEAVCLVRLLAKGSTIRVVAFPRIPSRKAIVTPAETRSEVALLHLVHKARGTIVKFTDGSKSGEVLCCVFNRSLPL